MLIIPYFKDGVVVKATDLERLKIYSRDLAIAVSNTSGPGVLYGMDFLQVGGNFILQPGAARLDSGEIVVIDSSDNLTISFTSVISAAGPGFLERSASIYLYKQNVTQVTTRQNLANVPQVIADKWVCGLSLTTPTVENKVLLGQFIFKWGLWQWEFDKFLRNPATSINIHTDTWVNNLYTGPRLHGTDAIVPFSITNTSIATKTITGNKIEDRTLLRRNINQEFGLAIPGTIMAYAGTDLTPVLPVGASSHQIHLDTPSRSGWLLCDGRSLPKPAGPSDLYYKLWQAIGATYGETPTRFYLPDLRGVFIRGFDPRSGDASRDPDRDGGGFGQYQSDQIKKHTHKVPNHKNLTPDGTDDIGQEWGGVAWTPPQIDVYTDEGTDLGSETRPKNIAMHYIIYTGEYYI